MAQPFETRFAKMMQPGARASDVETLIAEAAQLHAQAQGLLTDAKERAADPLSTLVEAREARQQAEDIQFSLDRLSTQIAKLRERHGELTETDEARAMLADYEDAAAENAALAEELAQVYPRVLGELVDLFGRIEAHEKRLQSLPRPGGKPTLASPEAVARRCDANFYWQGITPVERLLKMKLPNFGDHDRAWPIDHAKRERVRLEQQQHANLVRQKIEKEEAEARFRKRLEGIRRYRATAPASEDEFFVETAALSHVYGEGRVTKGPRPETVVCDLFQDQVEPARKAGFTLALAADDVLSLAFRPKQAGPAILQGLR